jgi:hypothetical protein
LKLCDANLINVKRCSDAFRFSGTFTAPCAVPPRPAARLILRTWNTPPAVSTVALWN